MKKFGLFLVLAVSVMVLSWCGHKNTAPGGWTQAGSPELAPGQEVAIEWKVLSDTETVTLAQCITENGVTMYGTERCSHCKTQKAMFGDAFTHIDYVDCDADKGACATAQIKGYPTWVDTDGKQYPGTQSLEKLANVAGCEG